MTARKSFSYPIFVSLTLLTALLATFQACSKKPRFETVVQSGNGDGYDGKPQRFYFFDSQYPCQQADLLGQALPNAAVFNDHGLKLFRTNCQDIEPQALAATQYEIDPNTGVLNFEGRAFLLHPDSESLLLAQATCPAGLAEVSGASRRNLLADSQNLLTMNWFRHPGLTPSLTGSFSGIPSFSLTRSIASLTDLWRRLSQYPELQANRLYSLSFLAAPGSTRVARVMMFQDGLIDLQVAVDVETGEFNPERQNGISNLAIQFQSLGTFSFITVFFETPAGVLRPDLGVGPNQAAFSASIQVSDVRLVDTADYCR